MAILGLTHLGMCVSDLDRSRAFYRDLLGFRELSQLQIDGEPTAQFMGVDELDLRSVFLERDGLRLELMYFASPGCVGAGSGTPPNRRGLTHLSLRVDDIDDVVTKLEAAGAKPVVASRVQNAEWQSDLLWVLDPDGVRLEICQAPGDPFAVLGEPL